MAMTLPSSGSKKDLRMPTSPSSLNYMTKSPVMFSRTLLTPYSKTIHILPDFSQSTETNIIDYWNTARTTGNLKHIVMLKDSKGKNIINSMIDRIIASRSEYLASIIFSAVHLGADVNQEHPVYHVSPLVLAIDHQLDKVINALLRGNPSMTATTTSGNSLVHLAIAKRSFDIALKLIQRGAVLKRGEDTDEIKWMLWDTKWKTSLFWSVVNDISKENRWELATALIQQGIDVNDTRDGQHVIHVAAAQNQQAAISALLAHDVSIDESSSEYGTPLEIAVSRGHLDLVQFLIINGANINGSNQSISPLILSILRGNRDTFDLLLRNNANVNFVPKRSTKTPLHYAVQKSDRYFLEQLLVRFADPDVYNEAQVTPLLIAVAAGDEEKVRLLLEHNADPIMTTEKSRSPVAYALKKGKMAIFKMMCDALITNGSTQTSCDRQAFLEGMTGDASNRSRTSTASGPSELDVFD